MAASRPTTKYISAAVMKRMLIAGGKMLEVNKEQIDSLNVFPVPDGDTGTNMSLTMFSAIKEIKAITTTSMTELSDKLSKGALKGARGNSGVILSQILKGFATVISASDELDVKTFAKALKSGAELAYSAVSRPKEGTILTVIRIMAAEAIELAKRPMEYENFLNLVIAKGEEILAQTPEMLDVLKKAGVVDSGGFGLIIMFKGMLLGYLDQEVSGAESYEPNSISGDNSTGNERIGESPEQRMIDYEALGDIEFGYCTEFFIINLLKKTTVTDIDKLRDYLNTIGNSVICIGDLSLVKIHVHTNNPGKALEAAVQLGELDKLKIENMLEQNRELRAKYEAEKKPIGILSVCAGSGFSAIFKDLLVDQTIEGGQTMNPSAEDIASAIRKINAENIIVLPNNKNIILAAEQSRALVSNRNVYVLQTRDIPQGISAVLAYNPDSSLNDNLKAMNESIQNVMAGSVTFAVRDTQVNNLKLKKGDILGLQRGDIVNTGHNVEEVTLSLIAKMSDPSYEIITMYYGNEVSEENAEKLAEKVQTAYPDCEVNLHFGGQPLYYYILSLE